MTALVRLALASALIASATAGLNACSPRATKGSSDFVDDGQNVNAAGFRENTTGFVDPGDHREYTAMSDDGQMQKLLERPELNMPRSLALAATVQSVEVRYVGAAKPSTARNAQVSVALDSGRMLTFEGAIDGSIRTPQILKSKASDRDSLSVVCADSECASARITLRERQADGSMAYAAFLRRVRDARLRVIRKTGPQTAALPGIAAGIAREPKRKLTTLEVAHGRAFFRIGADGDDVCPAGRAVDTDAGDDQVSRLACGDKPAPAGVSAALAGNTTTGAAILRFQEGDASKLFVLIDPGAASGNATSEPDSDFYAPGAPADQIELPPVPPVPPTQLPPPSPAPPSGPKPTEPSTLPANSLFSVEANDARTVYVFNARKRPEMQTGFRHWQNKGFLPHLQQMAAHGRALLNAMSQILKNEGAWPGYAIVPLQEQASFFGPGAPRIRSNPYWTKGRDGKAVLTRSSAAGPWQLLDGTATSKALGPLHIIPLAGSIKAELDPCDDRADWTKETSAAGRYLSLLLRQFHEDPLLAMLAFAVGEGRTSDAIGSAADASAELNDAREIGLSYWKVMEYHLAHTAKRPLAREKHEYVMNAAAAFLIAQAPGDYPEYGLTLGPAEELPAATYCRAK